MTFKRAMGKLGITLPEFIYPEIAFANTIVAGQLPLKWKTASL